MTAEALPDVRRGYCSEHPNQRLATHRAAGLQWWHAQVEVVCVFPDHVDGERERCRYCGGPLYKPDTPTWHRSPRRTYCSDLHRLHAFRSRRATR